MTTSATARRSGLSERGPPSWKISSTDVSFFRTATSGMDQAPVVGGLLLRHPSQWTPHHTRLTAQMQRGGADPAFGEKVLGSRPACGEGEGDFVRRQGSDCSGDRLIAQVVVRGEFAGWYSGNIHVTWKIDRV